MTGFCYLQMKILYFAEMIKTQKLVDGWIMNIYVGLHISHKQSHFQEHLTAGVGPLFLQCEEVLFTRLSFNTPSLE